MSAAWLSSPVVLTGMRMSECGKKTPEECAYVRERWHFWYIADYVFALPTIAFFMCAIGIFILSHLFTSLFLRQKRAQRNTLWRKGLAVSRYLSYRGFHVRKLGWSSAPIGVLLLGAAGTIFFFCMVVAPQPYYWASKKFGNSPPLATRSGWLALGCMPFIFATASKTNWITLFTGISYERLQVFHRWIAYAFFVLGLLHTFPFIVYHVHWHDMQHHFSSNLLYYWTGIVAILFQAWLTFMSHSTIRSFGYEVFKATHFFSAIVFILTFFWHCDHTLTSWHYFVATAAVYVPCFVFPLVRSAFEYKWTQQARISVEDNGFTKISIPAKCAYWTPGQHCFLRFTGFGVPDALSAHPFTICSLPPRETGDKSELVFYIRHQKGFTHKLYQYALTKPDSTIPVVVDGPYGGASALKLRNADRLLVIAGGSGAGWCLPFLEHFLRSTCEEEQGKSSSTVSGAKYSALWIVLVTRDTASRLWFEQAAAHLLARFPSANAAAVQIQVYLTGSAAAAATATATSTVPQAEFSEKPQVEPMARHVATTTASSSAGSDIEIEAEAQNANTTRIKEGDEFTGRPNLPLIVREESGKAADADEVLNVYVCGPDTMQDDVRNAVAGENVRILGSNSRTGAAGVYLHSEHFSWA